MLNFPTNDDFHQTASYVLYDSTQRANFRNSFQLLTFNKKSDIIIDSINSFLPYPSKVTTLWPNYSEFVDWSIINGDTIYTSKYGVWGEFLNLSNLITINGYLYKVTKDKTIIITSGNVNELNDAEEMEESDFEGGVYIIQPRICLCFGTHMEWTRENVVYNGSDYRVINKLIFSDLSLVTFLPNNEVEVIPSWSIESNIKIQERGWTGIWGLDRHNISFKRKLVITHNYETITDLQPDGSWQNLENFVTGNEGDYHNNIVRKYETYTTDQTPEMPLGYCYAVRDFAQSGTITNPSINNWFSFSPFPYIEFSGYHPLPPNLACPALDWLYYL